MHGAKVKKGIIRFVLICALLLNVLGVPLSLHQRWEKCGRRSSFRNTEHAKS